MKHIVFTILILLLIFNSASCKNAQSNEQKNESDIKNIKEEGQVYLSISPNFSGEIVSLDKDIIISISCGYNGLPEQVPYGAELRLLVSSEDVNISQSEMPLIIFSDEKNSDDSSTTYEYVLSDEDILSNIGSIKFEIQLLAENDKVIEFANKNIYYGRKGEQLYITGAAMEPAINFLSQNQDIYYDSVQGNDFFTECFWYNEDEKTLYYVNNQSDLKVIQYMCEEKNGGLSAKTVDDKEIFFIEVVGTDKMKINDKLYYLIDEELYGE